MLTLPVAAQGLRLPPDVEVLTDEPSHNPASPAHRLELWAGAEASRSVWSLYSGGTWAPFGALGSDGWRVRAVAGHGRYSYDTLLAGTMQPIQGAVSFADALVGYQVGAGTLTLKVFGGATFSGHTLIPYDAGNPMAFDTAGIKAAAEAWLELPADMFLSANLSIASLHDETTARIRLGFRPTLQLAAGLELGGLRNEAGGTARGGAFVRYVAYGMEVTASAGLAGTPDYGLSSSAGLYGTVSMLFKQ